MSPSTCSAPATRTSWRPFAERRARLEALLSGAPEPLRLTPATGERGRAEAWLERFAGGGVDGVVAKPADAPYRPGARAMVKVKRERTTDCVVGGYRYWSGRPLVGSLLLGLYDDAGALRHVGVASAFPVARRAELLEELRPLAVDLAGHPWASGWGLEGGAAGRLHGAAARWDPATMARDWVPLAPVRVCEVAHDQLDGLRFRHPARFRRWRPDRDPRSCTIEQLAEPAAPPAELLAA